MLPQDFLQRMEKQLGEEFSAYFRAMEGSPVRGLRFLEREGLSVQRIRELASWELTPIPYTEDGFYLHTQDKLGRHPLHHAGLIYLQEPGAMFPVSCLPFKKGDRVLDLCSAPGGKSLQAAAAIGKSGFLVSNEIMPARCKVLAGNLERAGIRNVMVTCEKAENLARAWPEGFDAVIVDAPCSGEGMFRKDEEAVAQWNQGLVNSCAALQRELLSHAAQLVRPGGYLLYATCTFSPQEDEETVSCFLKEQGEFELCPLPEKVRPFTRTGDPFYGDPSLGNALALTARFYPHTGPGEGQFAALLRKKGEAPRREFISRFASPDRETLALARDFLEKTLGKELPVAFQQGKKGEKLLFLPPEGGVDPGELRVQQNGVPLGTVQLAGSFGGKGREKTAQSVRFTPHHWFFKAYGNEMRNRLELTLGSPLVGAYLRGEELPAPGLEDGYAAVLLEGCPLGGGKVTKGRLKNHYPKGLRDFG